MYFTHSETYPFLCILIKASKLLLKVLVRSRFCRKPNILFFFCCPSLLMTFIQEEFIRRKSDKKSGNCCGRFIRLTNLKPLALEHAEKKKIPTLVWIGFFFVPSTTQTSYKTEFCWEIKVQTEQKVLVKVNSNLFSNQWKNKPLLEPSCTE